MADENMMELLKMKYSMPFKDSSYRDDEMEMVLNIRFQTDLYLKSYKTEEDAKELFVNVAAIVYNHFKNYETQDVYEKIMLAKIIDGEVRALPSYLTNEVSRSTYVLFQDLGSFVKFVADSAINENLEQNVNETARLRAKQISDFVKHNFLNFFDEKNLTEDDKLFILGKLATLQEEQYEEFQNFYETTCENCEKDDCMYCNSVQERDTKWKRYENFKKTYEIYKQFVEKGEANLYACPIEDSMLIKIRMTSDSSPRAKKKTIFLPLSKEQWAKVYASKVKKWLEKNGVDENGKPRLDSADAIANYVALTTADFSHATGKEEIDEFVSGFKVDSRLFEKENNFAKRLTHEDFKSLINAVNSEEDKGEENGKI